MKTEQKQIEEMAKQMCGAIDNPCIHDCTPACGAREYAKRCFEAGYRKASDVIDAFVERIKERALQSCRKIINCYEVTRIETVIDEIAAEMWQEVEM